MEVVAPHVLPLTHAAGVVLLARVGDQVLPHVLRVLKIAVKKVLNIAVDRVTTLWLLKYSSQNSYIDRVTTLWLLKYNSQSSYIDRVITLWLLK